MTRLRSLYAIIALVGGLLSLFPVACAARADTLTIGAAPSLRGAFEAIVPMFEQEYSARVRVVYAPSPTLRRQIEHGASIDVFLPAAIEEVEKLHKKGLTLNGAPRVYAQTSLVLVMSAKSLATPISFGDVLPNGTRVGIGDPTRSSLGEITARALAIADPRYQKRLRLVHAKHGEDVVRLIETGQADVGIVYRVDAINNGQVRIINELPGGVDVTVQFGEAIVSTCQEATLGAARQFIEFITSLRIRKLLEQYGFEYVPSNR